MCKYNFMTAELLISQVKLHNLDNKLDILNSWYIVLFLLPM